MRNRIAITKQECSQEKSTFSDTGDEFHPSSIPSNTKLDYTFDVGEEQHLHSYFMQVMPLQQTIFSEGLEKTKNVRFLENVHGYFALSKYYSTELVLSNSWDSATVKDDSVFFYRVDGQTCELNPFEPREKEKE